MSFYYTQNFKKINFRKNPELYQIGKGEQGVLSVEPYKSEILPFWKFRTPDDAKKSSKKIYQMFLDYLEIKDFVGADMARKFLQMGFTRSRRYANHKSGRKYSNEDKTEVKKIDNKEIPKYKDERNKKHFVVTKTKRILPQEIDEEKAKSAEIFYKKYKKAMSNPKYTQMKNNWKSSLQI